MTRRRRCSVCGEAGHDRRRHLAPDPVDILCDSDGACEECETIMWERLCRFCRQRLCPQCSHVHACAETWIAKRLEAPELFVIELVEEDDGG